MSRFYDIEAEDAMCVTHKKIQQHSAALPRSTMNCRICMKNIMIRGWKYSIFHVTSLVVRHRELMKKSQLFVMQSLVSLLSSFQKRM